MPIPSGGLIHNYDLLDPACYPGSGTNIYDITGNLDLGSNASAVYDPTNGSLTYDGTGIGAYSTQGQYANITTTFTLSIWFKINDTSVTQLILNNGERTSAWSGFSLFFDSSSGRLDFGANYVWGGNFSCPVLNQGQWYNATYTFGSGTLNFYLDGVLLNTSSGLGNPLPYSANAYLAWGGNATAFFNPPQFQNKASYGVVAFYNTVLNGTQVQDIYNTYADQFLNPVPSNNWLSTPTSYPGSGTVISDAGEFNTNLNVNLTGSTYNDSLDVFYLDGTQNAALYTGPYSSNPNIGLYYNAFTWHIWYKNDTALGSNIGWMGERFGSNFFGWGCSKNNSGYLQVEAAYGSAFTTIATLNNAWNLISITYNRYTQLLDVYINGVNKLSTSTNLFVTGAPSSNWCVWNGRHPNGYVTEVAKGWFGQQTLYTIKQSGGQVLDYYNLTKINYPIAIYDFSDTNSYPAYGNTLYDVSLSNFDLTNATLTGTFAGSGQSKYYSFAGGSDQYYRNNTTSAFGSSNRLYSASMFMWLRSSNWDAGSGSYNCISGWGEDIGTGGGQLGLWKSLSSTFYPINNQWGHMGSGYATTNYPGGLTDGVWQHVGYVIDGTNASLYLDGVLVNQVPQNFVWPSNYGTDYGYISAQNAPYLAPITLGGLYTNYYPASGFELAYASFYNVALTGAGVSSLYNSQYERFYPPSPPPVPYSGLVGGRTFGMGFAG